jgi:hypothetical protein
LADQLHTLSSSPEHSEAAAVCTSLCQKRSSSTKVQLTVLFLLPADASGETSLEVQELPSCSDDDDELDSHLAAAVQAVGAQLPFPAPSAPLRCAQLRVLYAALCCNVCQL